MKKSESIKEITNIGQQVLPKNGHLWLYGSRARGDEKPSSDWDLLILLDKETIESSDYDNYAFPLSMLGWKTNMDINPILYTQEEWKRSSSSLFWHNVERDKIELI